MTIRWRFGIVAGIFLAVFSLYPQMKMLYLRGDAWNGHYAYNDIDEVAYAAYIRALIDGRPRKNDPYTGRDDSPDTPQPESLFSIQFAAPYTIAVPARILGIGAPWAMTLGGAFAAFFAALALFWLIRIITEDDIVALAGTLVTLAGGALFAGEGAIGEITGWSYAYPYFPGFRVLPDARLRLEVDRTRNQKLLHSSTPLLLHFPSLRLHRLLVLLRLDDGGRVARLFGNLLARFSSRRLDRRHQATRYRRHRLHRRVSSVRISSIATFAYDGRCSVAGLYASARSFSRA